MKKKPILKAKLWREARAVYFQVLEQDEKKIKRGEFKFDSQRTGMNVSSCEGPQLGSCTIFLRGRDRIWDNKIDKFFFPSLKEANKYYQRCKTALTELVDYLNSKPKKIPATESVVIGG